jgi:phosphoglycolate phosphatase
MSDLRLVVFDVDGTLVDSQAHILAAMERAFAEGHPPPPRERGPRHRRPVAARRHGAARPRGMPGQIGALVDAYKAAFATMREDDRGAVLSPLFPGAQDCLAALSSDPWTLLGIATGKSRRGLNHLFDLHGFAEFFQTVQVADDHPSKPHPAMLEACLRETGVAPWRAVMVGDTTYDVEMARAAGMAAIGVSWGYHPVEALRAAGASVVIDHMAALPSAIEMVLEAA